MKKLTVILKSLVQLRYGEQGREFLYSEDMADACVFLLENRDFKDTYREDDKEIHILILEQV